MNIEVTQAVFGISALDLFLFDSNNYTDNNNNNKLKLCLKTKKLLDMKVTVIPFVVEPLERYPKS